MSQAQLKNKQSFPDLWGLTANEVANKKSGSLLSVQEYQIEQNADIESEVRSIDSVAFYPLHLLLNNLSPFDYVVDTDQQVPDSFVPIFENSVKLYQLYIFYVYSISELGSAHAETILKAQSKHVESWLDKKQGNALSAKFTDLSEAAMQHSRDHNANFADSTLDIPIENSLSKVFLTNSEDSPFYVDKKENKKISNFRGIDLALAEHLGFAKDVALQVFSRYFSVVIVDV